MPDHMHIAPDGSSWLQSTPIPIDSDRLWTTPNDSDSGRFRATPDDKGHLGTTPGDSRQN